MPETTPTPQPRPASGGTGFKASAQRIVAWIKAHPIPSLIILVVLLVIGYFLYKRAGSSAGSSSGDLSVTAPGDGGISGTLAGPGGGDQVGATGGGGGGQIGYEPPTYQPPGGGGGGGGGYIPPAGGGGAPVDYSGFLLPTANEPALISGASSLSDQLQAQHTTQARAASGPIVRPQGASTPLVGSQATYSSGPGGKSKGKGKGKTSGMTPAQLAGKGKNFTGFINGVQYINGYPVNLTAGQSYLTTSTPGGEVQQVTQTSSGIRRKF